MSSIAETRQRILEKFLRSDRAQSSAEKWLRENGHLIEAQKNSDGFDYAEGAQGFDVNPIRFEAERFPVLEAIIRLAERPTVLVQDDVIDYSNVEDFWRDRLRQADALIRNSCYRIARVDGRGAIGNGMIGTGFLVTPDLLVSNRHVAEVFAEGEGTSASFRAIRGGAAGAVADFKCETGRASQPEHTFTIRRIRFMAPANGHDLSILEIDRRDQPARDPLVLAAHPCAVGQSVMVIGHPAQDSRADRGSMLRIFPGEFRVKRVAPGEVMETGLEGGGVFTHDCSTLGGNSGSAVIDLGSGEVLGLHYGGSAGWQNYAVTAQVVRDALSRI